MKRALVFLLFLACVKPTPAPAAPKAPKEQQLSEARAAYDKNPNDADAIIWLGRRYAYLGRYREAILTFDEGRTKFPRDARFLRHRGHRLISIRQYREAENDLSAAAELARDQPDAIEPDGMPNAKNIPLTSLHSNIHYHLGLARYLQHNYEGARTAYEACAAVPLAQNPDHIVSTTYWRYLILSKLGREEEAHALLDPITADMPMIENEAYLRLLILFKTGAMPTKDDPTTLYGVGMWHLLAKREQEANALFLRAVGDHTSTAFGALAAEVELAH